MKRIAIIGGGFSGTMVSINLVEKASNPVEVFIINRQETFNKGIAYNPYSAKHLLNVTASRMSAFHDNPSHFLNWVLAQREFLHQDRELIANSFLPRRLYGEYLKSVWSDAVEIARKKNVHLKFIDGFVADIELHESKISLLLDDSSRVDADYCVMATGNQQPRNPHVGNPSFYKSGNYFQNPWQMESVTKLSSDLPVLIIGNGLTMVDTVLGLHERGFAGEIVSISPNGFNILPHRHNGLAYTKLISEFPKDTNLPALVRLVNTHVKRVREFGVSAEPVIDSIRQYTQPIWKNLSNEERRLFMSRLRHLWGVARHRIPLHTHDKIQQLRIDGKLQIIAGRVIDFKEGNESINVEYFDKRNREVRTLSVSRVINCTGPETDFMRIENSFLKNCLLKGIIRQDELLLGIVADTETFEVFNSTHERTPNLFTLGSNLKGELWESTAVHEIRVQAEQLAGQILNKISKLG